MPDQTVHSCCYRLVCKPHRVTLVRVIFQSKGLRNQDSKQVNALHTLEQLLPPHHSDNWALGTKDFEM